MLNSRRKFRAFRNKRNKYSNSCVVRKNNSERNKKPYPPPPCKLNGRSLINHVSDEAVTTGRVTPSTLGDYYSQSAEVSTYFS